MLRRMYGCLLLGAVVVAALAGDARALRFQERPAWMAGVGYGIGRGTFETPEGGRSEYSTGVNPQIRFGRMIGRRAMIGVNYSGWLVEFGEVPTKIRRSLQNTSLTMTFFPGDPTGPYGGLYLRAGGGLGWTGTAEVEIVPGGKQERGVRLDEWGAGFVGEIGYEFWLSGNFAAGVISSINYMDIAADIVERGWFGSAGFTLNLYF